MTDYTDVAHQAFNDLSPWPPVPRDVEDVRPYLLHTLALLPVEDQIGYCKTPEQHSGYENSIQLPNGTWVRVARVVWPNGQIVKIMSDVPNGGPQWVEEDVRPELYHPYDEGGNGEEPPDDDLVAKVAALEEEVRAIWLRIDEIEKKAARQEIQLQQYHDRMEAINDNAVHPPLPNYIWAGRLPFFGGNVTIISEPIPKKDE